MGQVISSKYFTPPVMGKKPPSRILAFRWGVNDTKKGPFYLTEESAKSIIENFEKNKNPIVFDLEHLSLDEDAPLEDKRALAYGPRLELDETGLWVTDVAYTDEGYELIEAGKWGFTSPVFLPNLFNEIKSLTGMGFTNHPATRGARPLLLSTGDAMNEQMPMPMNNELVSKVKPLRDMQSYLGACMNVAQEAMNTHINSPVAMMARKMSDSLPEWITAIAELLEQMDPQGLSKPEMEMDAPKMSVDMMMPMKKMSENDPNDPPKEEEKEGEKPKQLSSQIDTILEVCQELTGESDHEKIKAKLLALKHNLSVTEQALSEAKSNEKVLLVDAAIAQGKIPPLEKERFLKLSVEGIQTYLSAAKSKKEMFPDVIQRHTQFSPEEMNETAVSPEVRERVNNSVNRIFARIGL